MAGGSCKDLILQKCVLVSYADLLTNFALFASALIGDFVADQTLNNVIFYFLFLGSFWPNWAAFLLPMLLSALGIWRQTYFLLLKSSAILNHVKLAIFCDVRSSFESIWQVNCRLIMFWPFSIKYIFICSGALNYYADFFFIITF